MSSKILAGGGGIASPIFQLGDSSAPAKRRAARAVIVLLAIALSLFIAAPSALAASVEGNTAYVTANDDPDISNQTIVGEGQNNNVVITNSTTDSPSPTGIFMANLPVFIIGAFVVAGAAVVIARARKKAGEEDE